MLDFRASLDDDLNSAEALAAVFELIREANIAMDAGEYREGNIATAKALLAECDLFFDVMKPSVLEDSITESEIAAAVEARTAAKSSRDFKKADEIRAELLEKGVVLEDTKDGVRWKRK